MFQDFVGDFIVVNPVIHVANIVQKMDFKVTFRANFYYFYRLFNDDHIFDVSIIKMKNRFRIVVNEVIVEKILLVQIYFTYFVFRNSRFYIFIRLRVESRSVFLIQVQVGYATVNHHQVVHKVLVVMNVLYVKDRSVFNNKEIEKEIDLPNSMVNGLHSSIDVNAINYRCIYFADNDAYSNVGGLVRIEVYFSG